MQSEIDSLRQRITELELRNAKPIKQIIEENNRHDVRLRELETRILKLEQDQSKRESKKNRKF